MYIHYTIETWSLTCYFVIHSLLHNTSKLTNLQEHESASQITKI